MLSDVSLRSSNQQHGDALLYEGGLTVKLGRHKKRVFAFAALLVGLTVGLGSLNLLSAGLGVFLLQLAGFFGLGYLHAVILRTNIAQLTPQQKLLYTFLLSGLLVGVLTAFYYLVGTLAPLTVFAYGCAFVWPYTVEEALRLFESFSSPPVMLWRYDPELPLQKSTTFLNSIPVRFKIQAGQLSEEGRIVSFRAPVRMKLGLIFYHTVQDQNSKTDRAIDLLSLDNQPYGWLFSIAGFGGSRNLDPELSLFENGIKENNLILARRIQPEFALPEA